MNEPGPQLTHSQERWFSAHNSFIHVATLELELAKPGLIGEFNHALTAVTFCALAVEALANAIGERIVPDWSDFESMSPFGKLRFLAERLGEPYSSEAEPWQSLRWLCRLRNRLAHAKPELVKREELLSQAEHAARRFRAPQSKLETEISEANARRAIAAVEAVKYALCNRVPIDLRFGLQSDGWVSRASLSHGA